jgi:hypothetical protein
MGGLTCSATHRADLFSARCADRIRGRGPGTGRSPLLIDDLAARRCREVAAVLAPRSHTASAADAGQVAVAAR